MANHKSSIKRARQTIKKNARNSAKRSAARTAVKAIKLAISNKDRAAALKLLPKAQSLLAKNAKASAIHKSTAARKTSRLMEQIASL